jgi:hypothetical protein
MYNSDPTDTNLKDRSHSSPSSRRESPATNTDEAIQGIEEALEDIKQGRVYSNNEVKEELGIL